VVDPDAHPARVAREVVDAIGHGLALGGDEEVVYPHGFGLARRAPRPPGILEITDQLLLLRIDRDHRLARGLELTDLRDDVAELGVPVRVRRSFARLAVGLQAVPCGAQQFSHQLVADAVPHTLQGLRQGPSALRGPAQGRVRGPRGRGLDQARQIAHQRGVLVDRPLPAPTRPSHPSLWLIHI
jgi:hypothetical protein